MRKQALFNYPIPLSISLQQVDLLYLSQFLFFCLSKSKGNWQKFLYLKIWASSSYSTWLQTMFLLMAFCIFQTITLTKSVITYHSHKHVVQKHPPELMCHIGQVGDGDGTRDWIRSVRSSSWSSTWWPQSKPDTRSAKVSIGTRIVCLLMKVLMSVVCYRNDSSAEWELLRRLSALAFLTVAVVNIVKRWIGCAVGTNDRLK